MDYQTALKKRAAQTPSISFRDRPYDYIYTCGRDNLFESIRDAAVNYFNKNRVKWWRHKFEPKENEPTGNTTSSQVACINHLFALRHDKEAVLSIIRQIHEGFDDVLVLENDAEGTRGYISFEVISKGKLLKEREHNRGSHCTSIDAVILGVRKGKNVVIVIEWKLAEKDRPDSKSQFSADREWRYKDLINNSGILQGDCHSTYYFKPFYQLMRQTLWAKQIIKHYDTEDIKAVDYVHLHVIPPQNKSLLDMPYKCVNGLKLEEAWREQLLGEAKNKYRIISPKELLARLDRKKYGELLEYLEHRYWSVLPKEPEVPLRYTSGSF